MDIERLLQSVETIHVPESIVRDACARIRREQGQRAVRQRIVVFGLLFILSLTGLLVILDQTRTAFAHSSALTIASLALSDPDIVFAFWDSFIFSLLESLPMIGLSTLLTTCGCILFATWHLISTMKRYEI